MDQGMYWVPGIEEGQVRQGQIYCNTYHACPIQSVISTISSTKQTDQIEAGVGEAVRF